MAARPQTYRPPIPAPHATPIADQQAREDLAVLLEHLAEELRSGAATESGLHVKRGHGWRSDPEAAPTVRIAVTTIGPSADFARRLLGAISHDDEFDAVGRVKPTQQDDT